MENSTIKELLTEYDYKRRAAIRNCEERKKELFSSNKELEELENKISKLSISSSISLITADVNKKKEILDNLNIEIEKLKKEKDKILLSIGKDSSFLLPIYDCSICNDTGFILVNNKSEMCNCLKQKLYNIEYNKSNIGNLDKENFSTFNINKYSEEPNKEKYNSDLSPRENILLIKKICENFIVNFDNPSEKNLLFTGNTGLGKTFLSNCIANELLKNGKTILYQTAPVMLDSIINYRFNKPNCNLNIIENLLNVDLLIIDDLGTETINNMKFTELFNIINTRLLNQNHKVTKTIISTNLNLKNIFSIYEERLRF